MGDLSRKTILIGILAVVILFGGLFVAWKATSKSSEITVVDITIGADDHVNGNRESGVIMVEYSDFQCPACKAYHPLLRQVAENNKENIAFVYRHFPLPQHEKADEAASAAVAAGMQNKFFEYHDLLFDNQSEWSTAQDYEDRFIEYAQELDLDVEQFNKDMTSSKVKDKIEKDKLSGGKFGVNSTPTVFLNGKKLDLPRSVEAFQELIDAELAGQSQN